MTPEERTRWLADRRRGIGGSDAGAIVGVNKWRTQLDVYYDKTGEADPIEDNDAMLWGRLLEPVIRQRYSDITGRTVQTPPMIESAEHPFMLANVDGIATGGRILEIKTARTAKGWGDEGTDQVPLSYLFQLHHYMIVTGLSVADVAVLIGGQDLRLYEVAADKDLQDKLVETEAAFWKRVQERDPPEPESMEDARRRFGSLDVAGRVEADADVYDRAVELQALSTQIDDLEAQADVCRTAIMTALGEHGDTLMHDGAVIATWKLAKAPTRFDTKRFRDEHADLYQQYAKAGTPSRRLLLRDIQEAA